VKRTVNGLGDASSGARKLHRPLALRKISSLHFSRNPGPESWKTARKPLTCIGVGTEAAER